MLPAEDSGEDAMKPSVESAGVLLAGATLFLAAQGCVATHGWVNDH
jgi:hypothetical protein